MVRHDFISFCLYLKTSWPLTLPRYGGRYGCLGSYGGSCLEKENPALKLHCILPCEGQADGWSASARERFFSILEQADEVVYVSREYREGCMLERNRYLVDHAACLLAVYNGEWRCGTAMTVRYARKMGREIIVIDPALCQPMPP